jgi:hypothetical protein
MGHCAQTPRYVECEWIDWIGGDDDDDGWRQHGRRGDVVAALIKTVVGNGERSDDPGRMDRGVDYGYEDYGMDTMTMVTGNDADDARGCDCDSYKKSMCRCLKVGN